MIIGQNQRCIEAQLTTFLYWPLTGAGEGASAEKEENPDVFTSTPPTEMLCSQGFITMTTIPATSTANPTVSQHHLHHCERGWRGDGA